MVRKSESPTSIQSIANGRCRPDADVVEHADVRVIEPGDRLCLPLESRFHLHVVGEMRRKDFDGDHAIQTRIAGPVNFTLPSGADGGEDFVAGRV